MKFEIGEVAILASGDNDFGLDPSSLAGMEVTIINIDYLDSIYTYQIDLSHNGKYVWSKEKGLRKKKPPSEDKKRENPDVIESQNKDYDPTLTPWSPPEKEKVKE